MEQPELPKGTMELVPFEYIEIKTIKKRNLLNP